MKAIVYGGIGKVALKSVPDPKIKQQTDAIIRITSSAICGTDLHFIRGTALGMKEGRILGHEAVGIVEEVGRSVRNLRKGDRVVVPPPLAVVPALIVAPATSHNATWPIPAVRRQVPCFLAGRRKRVAWMDFRLSTLAFRLPAWDW